MSNYGEIDDSYGILDKANRKKMRDENLIKAGTENANANLSKEIEELLVGLGYNEEEKKKFIQELKEANKNGEKNIDGNRETYVEKNDGPEM